MAQQDDVPKPERKEGILKLFDGNVRLLVLILLILEVAFGLAIVGVPESQRLLAFIFMLLFLAVSGFMAMGLIKLSDVAAKKKTRAYNEICKVLSDYDYLFLCETSRQNHNPSVLFRRTLPDDEIDVDRFTTGLLRMMELGLIETVGTRDIGITEAGREFLAAASKDTRFHNIDCTKP